MTAMTSLDSQHSSNSRSTSVQCESCGLKSWVVQAEAVVGLKL